MSPAAKSVWAFGAWGIGAGLGLLLIPTLLLSIVRLEVAEPVFIRVIGFILIEIGIAYIYLARQNITGFFDLSVKIRIIPVIALTTFVVSGMGPWQLILFAIVDALSALHTWWCLRQEKTSA